MQNSIQNKTTMKLYRIRHKNSGLYYKPLTGGGNNLSKTGKVYTGNSNAITNSCDYLYIQMNGNSKLLSEYLSDYEWKEERYNYGFVYCKIPKSEFEIENLQP